MDLFISYYNLLFESCCQHPNLPNFISVKLKKIHSVSLPSGNTSLPGHSAPAEETPKIPRGNPVTCDQKLQDRYARNTAERFP